MKKTKQYLLIVVILLFGVSAKAQYSFYHEYGASLGTTLINGDWHKDSGAMSVLGFRGVKGGFIHGMQMVRERYSIKNSLDFSYISNVHGDKLPNDWVVNANKDLEDANGDPLPYKRDTDDEKKWADMSGTSMLVTLGSQIEYNFIDFGLYYPRNDWTPYVGAGFDVMYYHSSLSTTRGQFTPENIPAAYASPQAYGDGEETLPETQNGITTAIKASIGAKIHLTRFITLFGEFTLKRSFGDKIDGLDLVYSKSPDYINSINIGVKHVLY